MKRVIRYGCYETNSSSAHSVCITKNDKHVESKDFVYDEIKDEYPDNYVYLNKDGELSFLRDVEEGYGRYPLKILTSVEDKLQYAMCEYMGYLYPDDPEFAKLYNMFVDIAIEIIPGCTGLNLQEEDFDLYLDQNGNEILHKDLHYDHWDGDHDQIVYYYIDENNKKQIAVLNEEDYLRAPKIGAIDHQSMGLLKNFLKENKIDLKEFISNKRYVIVQDGDEYMEFDRLLKLGFIDKNFITEIYSTSGEDLEYQEWLREQEENENEENN